MSRIPKIDTAIRNFEDNLEGAAPDKIYMLIDKLRTDIEGALDELLVENARRFVEAPSNDSGITE